LQETNRLIRHAQGGDAQAFEQLIAPFEQKVFALCLRIVGNREDASDCAQETFIRIYRSLTDYRIQASFSTWIYRIATNVCLDSLRKRKIRPAVSLDELMESGYAPVDAYSGVEDGLMRRDMTKALAAGIRELPPILRVAVVLRDVRGLSYEEVSKILRLNLGTVKSRISRGRERLRKSVYEQDHSETEQNRPAHVKWREGNRAYGEGLPPANPARRKRVPRGHQERYQEGVKEGEKGEDA